MRFLLILIAISAATPAAAQVGTASKGPVFVFKGDSEFREGYDLIVSGVVQTQPAALAPLLACAVEDGTAIHSLRVGESGVRAGSW